MSILNIYAIRCKKPRGDLATMMTATTWMDATAALAEGFIDGIAEDTRAGLTNASLQHTMDRAEAEARVKAWLDRRRQQPSRPEKGDEHTSTVLPEQAQRPEDQGETARSNLEQKEQTEQPEEPGTPVAQLQKRLGLLMSARRR